MKRMKPYFPSAVLFLGFLAVSLPAHAAGKKKPKEPPPPDDGRRVIALSNIRDVRIELPNQQVKDFGQGFQARLTTRLVQGGRFIIADTENPPVALSRVSENAPDYHWSGRFVPAAKVRIVVDAMSFATGDRGDRMFYGFDERMRTPFNDGFGTKPNEFPMRKVAFEPNWFDQTFDEKGSEPFDSHAGLDLGQGIDFDILFAWLHLKYASYRTELRLRVFIDAPLADRNEYRDVNVKGQGYFYDVVGGYMAYSLGITIARTDAMLQAINRALDGTYDVFERALQNLPLTAGVDAILRDGTILLGTGFRANVRAGTLYQAVRHPGLIIEVKASVDDGSIGHLVRGDLSALQIGEELRQIAQLPAENAPVAKAQAMLASGPQGAGGPVLAASENIKLPDVNFNKPDLQGSVPAIGWFQAFLKSLEGMVLLPYRIYRYFSYDQSYHKESDGSVESLSWPEIVQDEPWIKQIGLNHASSMANAEPVVAVIDSGVDYNHPAIHPALWLNPAPSEDPAGRKDRYGWDFISGDSKAYDDGYHGTEVASAVLAVAPNARIMSLKVFNPWGVTSSAAIYSAIAYAVDHGAKIILCGWATRVSSQAIEAGVAYAKAHGAEIVAAAGDRGDLLSDIASYPAAFSKKYDNVLTVTGVDAKDELVKVRGRFANYDPGAVEIAAPGQDILVADPRADRSRVTSTAISAGLVAGALARKAASGGQDAAIARYVSELLDDAERIAGLESFVRGGKRLRIR